MNRVAAIAALALSLFCQGAFALEIKPYSAAALSEAQAAGKAVALHFHADWCPTCRAQSKVFDSLKSDQSLAVTVLVADYDNERALKQKLNVRTQSTLIVYRGGAEKARLAGETSAEKLLAALRSAL
jgi:thiol:disulfide interchange protein